MYDYVYEKNMDYMQCQSGESSVFINLKTGNWVKLNDTAIIVLELIDGKRCLGVIVEEIAQRFHLKPDIIKSIYRDVFESLITSCVIINISSDARINDSVDIESQEIEFPEQIWVHITNVCNLSCPYCYFSCDCIDINASCLCDCDNMFINREDLFSLLRHIPQDYRKEVIISGGEPFLNNDLIGIVRYLKNDLCFTSITVITNGTVRHEDYSQVLEYIDIIQISLDGTTEVIHETARGLGSFQKTLNGIKTAVSINKDKVKVSYTLTDSNIHDIKELPEFCYNNQIASIHINKVIHVGKGMHHEIEFCQSRFDEEYSLFNNNAAKQNAKIHYQREIKEIGIEKKRPFLSITSSFDLTPKISVANKLISCGAGIAIISIAPDGYVYPCPSLHIDDYKIGITRDSIIQILENGKVFNEKHNVEAQNTACYNCDYKYFCGGGCRAEAYSRGDIDGKYSDCSTILCDIVKAISNFKL